MERCPFCGQKLEWSQKSVPNIGKEIEEEMATIKAETERSYFRVDAKEIQHMLK